MSKGVRRIFSQVFSTYETVNHILTFGLDMLWRKRASRFAVEKGGGRWLEVCAGTGETASILQKHAGQDVLIVATDFSFPMIESAAKKGRLKKSALLLAEAGTLPFADEIFDLVIISFATRNLNSTRTALADFFREFHRVLKPGGRFVNLETSQPSSPFIQRLYHLYVRLAVRPIGVLISGSRAGYSYLSYTIPRFHSPSSLGDILREAGFGRVRWTSLFLGVAAIHEAAK